MSPAPTRLPSAGALRRHALLRSQAPAGSGDGPTPTEIDALPDATIATIVAEAALDITQDYRDHLVGGGRVVYVRPPLAATCAREIGCIALAPLLGLRDALAGHLHHDPGSGAGPAARPSNPPGSADLQTLAALVESDVYCDLLDACLAKSRHDVADLGVTLAASRTVGIAVGVLMAVHRCDAQAAVDRLEQLARAQNRPLGDVASEVQAGGAPPAPPVPELPEPGPGR